MNLLFYKGFLTPSKNHANHCQIMFDYKNQFEVKSWTATRNTFFNLVIPYIWRKTYEHETQTNPRNTARTH